MKFRTAKGVVLFTVLTISITSLSFAEARPKAKADGLANYSVIHAIPAGFGADVVDVYG